MVKCTYKGCDVEVTVMPDSPGMISFTPIVEIDCKTVGTHRMMVYRQVFSHLGIGRATWPRDRSQVF